MTEPTRDDLRFIIEDDDVEPLVMWVTDADLAAMGLVQLEPLRGDPITPSREALRFVRFGVANGLETQLVTDEELAAMGLVQAPECGECQQPCPRDTDGDGNCGQRFCPICGAGVCPKCGGSGYGPVLSIHSMDQFDSLARARGYVQAPECGECGGSGYVDERTCPNIENSPCRDMGCGHDCLKCGGSGYGRLVSLDVDVEALRRQLASWDDGHRPAAKVGYLAEIARQVLAALDGENT